MNTLSQRLDEYLALRRAMGFQLTTAGALLPRFIAFLEHHDSDVITTELALRWATEPQQVHPAEWGRRLSQVRGFARYLSAIDPRTEIPPTHLLPYRPARRTPYLYSDTEINQLLKAASELPSPSGLRAQTYRTVLALLVVTGMRISEVVALDNADVVLAQGGLTIRQTKCHKARWLALHPSTVAALQDYIRYRDCFYPHPGTPSFFLSETGTRLNVNTFEQRFVQLSKQIGLRQPHDRSGPRLHDFRHRFAVQTLLRWYRQDEDVQQRLPQLSTYLGHVKVSDTYWYLTAVPELMQLAMQRLESGDRSAP
jgi:integrase